VPLFIVTRPAVLTEHTLAVVDEYFGATPEFCVVDTVKVDRYAALVGAPVNVTVGAILSAVVCCVAEAAE
jgi:hypothetical protein